jgi:hypothetical protein
LMARKMVQRASGGKDVIVISPCLIRDSMF